MRQFAALYQRAGLIPLLVRFRGPNSGPCVIANETRPSWQALPLEIRRDDVLWLSHTQPVDRS